VCGIIGIVERVGVFLDVQIHLQLPRRVREKGPRGANAAPEVVRVEEVVRGYRDESAVSDLHFMVQSQQPFVLLALFGTVSSAR
jgi:hypothetical protein